MTSKIFLYNSLTKTKEEFVPLTSNQVRMYHCGPTVYADVHIGNLRSFFLADIVRRTMEWNGYDVVQVMNITDVGHLSDDGDHGDDKMTSALKKAGKPITLEAMLELATHYMKRFREDLASMHIKTPHEVPRASDHIQDDIALIASLVEKGHTYETADSLYFDTITFPEYGALGLPPLNPEHSRTGIDPDKKNPRDFALWKKNNELGWPSPWGQGFPGWHIECSGMATRYLGEHFDIHTGGIDLLPTHHNNEIAQSTCATSSPYVNYWLHNEHLSIDQAKMSKSLNNYYTLRDLQEQGFSALDLRYWFLQGNYRTKVDFTLESLKAAQTARRRLIRAIQEEPANTPDLDSLEYTKRFTHAINDNLGTPEALGIAWEVARDNTLSKEMRSALLHYFDRVLSIYEPSQKNTDLPEHIQDLAEQRVQARTDKNWDRADKLRLEIESAGFKVTDNENGQSITAA